MRFLDLNPLTLLRMMRSRLNLPGLKGGGRYRIDRA